MGQIGMAALCHFPGGDCLGFTASIQPGQIQVKASLAVTYEISEPKGPQGETGALPADPKRP